MRKRHRIFPTTFCFYLFNELYSSCRNPDRILPFRSRLSSGDETLFFQPQCMRQERVPIHLTDPRFRIGRWWDLQYCGVARDRLWTELTIVSYNLVRLAKLTAMAL